MIPFIDLDQSWIEEWQTGERPAGFSIEGVKWMRERPQVIKDLMIKFPPSCLVSGTRPLDAPRPGTIGRVVSYEDDGKIAVAQGMNSNYKAWCQPEWLKVEGYWKGLTSEEVIKILK